MERDQDLRARSKTENVWLKVVHTRRNARSALEQIQGWIREPRTPTGWWRRFEVKLHTSAQNKAGILFASMASAFLLLQRAIQILFTILRCLVVEYRLNFCCVCNGFPVTTRLVQNVFYVVFKRRKRLVPGLLPHKMVLILRFGHTNHNADLAKVGCFCLFSGLAVFVLFPLVLSAG